MGLSSILRFQGSIGRRRLRRHTYSDVNMTVMRCRSVMSAVYQLLTWNICAETVDKHAIVARRVVLANSIVSE